MQADRLLSIEQVREFVPVARSTLYALIAKGEFPKPRKMGKRNFWLQSDIQSFIAELPEAGICLQQKSGT